MTVLTRRSFGVIVLAGLASQPGHSATASISQSQFDAWLHLRGGENSPAFWYCSGLIRPIKAQGAVASRMIGVETWITPNNLRTATSAVSLSRKLFFFLHPERDELVTDPATGTPRRPSIFAYQVRTFTLNEGQILYDVESHDLRGIRHGGTGVTYTVNAHGDQVHVNYASFPRRAGPDGQMRVSSGEVYDYMDNGPRVIEEPNRFQMTWVGTNLDGQIANLRGWRYPNFDSIPDPWLTRTISEKASLWTAPPEDMAEIDSLRNTVPYPVPGLPV